MNYGKTRDIPGDRWNIKCMKYVMEQRNAYNRTVSSKVKGKDNPITCH